MLQSHRRKRSFGRHRTSCYRQDSDCKLRKNRSLVFQRKPECPIFINMIPTPCSCVEDSALIFEAVKVGNSLFILGLIRKEGSEGLEDAILTIWIGQY